MSKSSSYPSRSINKFPLQQAVRLAEIAVRSMMVPANHKPARLRRVRNIYGSTPLLIVASGPSAQNLDPARVNTLRREGKLRVLAINNFIGSKLGGEIEFDAYVLSDPAHRPDHHQDVNDMTADRTPTIWQTLAISSSLVFTPANWTSKHFLDIRDRHYVFDDRSLEGISRNISPLRPRGYKSLTLMKAISIALILTKGTVYLTGADQSTFLGLSVCRDNKLYLSSFHAEGMAERDEPRDISDLYPNGMEDYFFDEAHTSHQLRTMFSKSGRIINVNPSSFITCFPKADPLMLNRLSAF